MNRYRFRCPSCGSSRSCYNDERVDDEITEIDEELMTAALAVVHRYEGIAIVSGIRDQARRELIEDIHRAMHEREALKRRADRDFTASGLERFK